MSFLCRMVEDTTPLLSLERATFQTHLKDERSIHKPYILFLGDRWIFFLLMLKLRLQKIFCYKSIKCCFFLYLTRCLPAFKCTQHCWIALSFFLGVEIATSCVGQATDLHHWDLGHIRNDWHSGMERNPPQNHDPELFRSRVPGSNLPGQGDAGASSTRGHRGQRRER